MRQETTNAASGAYDFTVFNRREAQLMLQMMTGGSMDDLSPEELEIWELLLDAFKEFTLSI